MKLFESTREQRRKRRMNLFPIEKMKINHEWGEIKLAIFPKLANKSRHFSSGVVVVIRLLVTFPGGKRTEDLV